MARDFYYTTEAEVRDNGTKYLYHDMIRFHANALPFPLGTKLKLELTIYDEKKDREKKRTEQQNKYYHKLLDIICENTGDIHTALHDTLKIMFLARPWIHEKKEYLIVKSTRDLKPKEFGDYLEKVFQWASQELGLVLPSSSDYY